jgi:RNA recognition motif-containing protein
MTTPASNTWIIDIPNEPTANIVLIKNISFETKEATIKDFFSFCGTIKAFEMKVDEHDEKHQVAIVYFEKESAAKTATLLSQGNIYQKMKGEFFFIYMIA